jgi:hypothetical protein
MLNRLSRPLTILASLGILLSCNDDPASPNPDGSVKPEADLTFVRFDPTLFGSAQTTGSFWAVRGEDRELEMTYQEPDDSGDERDEFLEFRVRPESLLRRPDGTPFAEGDSVLITVTVDPGGRFIFDFQPAGLQFDPSEPAELEIDFNLADRDLNDDGVEDAEDDRIRAELSIWRQDAPGTVWERLESLRIREDELRADLSGFSGFATAN